MIGRLKPGVAVGQVKAALDSITLQLAKEYPAENEGRGVILSPPGLFIPSIRDASITFATVLMVIVGLVLLLACVNLANLQLARVTGRRKEIAIRLAVGATRGRLVRQLLTEGVLLARSARSGVGRVDDQPGRRNQTPHGYCARVRSEAGLAGNVLCALFVDSNRCCF